MLKKSLESIWKCVRRPLPISAISFWNSQNLATECILLTIESCTLLRFFSNFLEKVAFNLTSKSRSSSEYRFYSYSYLRSRRPRSYASVRGPHWASTYALNHSFAVSLIVT